jgi:mono/diheme cytochrome c family protein
MVVVALSFGVGLALMEGCKARAPLSGAPAQSILTSSLASEPPVMKFEATPARLERGKYIVEGPAHCFMCHSEVDWKSRGAQYLKDRKGAGKDWFDYEVPFVVASNLTPDVETGAGTWSDEVFARAIREGVGHDGRRLFPIMPYQFFSKMSDEDLASVVSYIRSVPPVHNKLRATAIPEPIKNSLPPVERITAAVPQPDMSNPLTRGEYLVTLGNCAGCHTPRDPKGAPIPGLDFSGGNVLKGPWGEVASANITPDPSGISYYDEATFIQTIRTGQVKARQLNSIMPWGYFRNMTDDDLKAIFAYLQTLKPVQHRVDNTEKPTHCELCGMVHGFGSRNLIH